MLPNFFVIGAYKSGTTSLYRYLSQHPEVFLPRVKEPNYFAFEAAEAQTHSQAYRNSVKTRAEYEALYAGADRYAAVGDVSPEYMPSSTAARTIRRHVPHAKLIAILRNPVERAYSDFLMYRRDGKEKLGDFARALDEQSDRAARQDPTGFYVSTGFYGRQLARYYDLFPADQIRVYLLEELTADSTRVLCRMFEFLGVDAAFVPGDLEIHNRSGVASSFLVSKAFEYRGIVAPLAKRLIPDKLRTRLRRKFEERLERPSLDRNVKLALIEKYREDVLLLERLTGISCRHWLE